MPRSNSARKRRLLQCVASLLRKLVHDRFTLRHRSRFARLRRWEHKGVRRPDSVRRAACPFADSRFFNVVPEWDSLSPDNVRPCLQARVAQCILRGKLPVAVPWVWALPEWFRRLPRRARVLQDVPELHLGVLASAMFREG